LSQGTQRPRGRIARSALLLVAVAAAGLLAPAGAGATSLTAGDVIVYRVGSGPSEGLSSSTAPAFLNEFEPSGFLITSVAFPTATEGSNKPLTAGGKATSEGLLTLSANGECVVATGYGAAPGTAAAEKKATEVPRVVGLVNAKAEVNTSTALTNAESENNVRSAVSSDCKKIWVGGAGTKTTGGVVLAEVGKTTGTQLAESDTNVRGLLIFGGQLYASADPLKAPNISIGTVGSGLPTTNKQTLTNLPFETAPVQPYEYAMLTLGTGSKPDTLYVVDRELFGKEEKGADAGVAKFGLAGGKWVQDGAVEIPFATGVAANDVNGVVTLYVTASGSSGATGTLYRVDDLSGANGKLSGIPAEIAHAPTNEAYRGVAFAPGTTIGSGGTPPPAPTISAAYNALPAALGDPTNTSLPITVGGPYSPGELTVFVTSSNESVAPVSGISVTGKGTERTVNVTPAAVGLSKLTIIVEAPNGAFAATQVNYGASEYLGNPSQRYYAGEGTAGAAVEVGEGYMLVASDESNIIDLYRSRYSSQPLKAWNFNEQLPLGQASVNIHSAARAGGIVYFVGSAENNNAGEFEPASDTVFAATITGSGAGTELSYLGGFTHLRESLIEWDNENGERLGFKKSAEAGKAAEQPDGFKLEGLEFAPGSSSEAYVTFRAPLESPQKRELALVVPITNFSSLITPGVNNGTNKPEFGTPLEWNLGGLSIRQIRKNASGEYLVIASTATSVNNVSNLYGWDGETEDEPVLLGSLPTALVEGGVWEATPSIPNPITNGSEVEALQDDNNAVWYGPGSKSAKKGLTQGLRKSIGELFRLQIPAPGVSGPPRLSSGKNPNSGQFTLRWKPAPTLRARFKLEHENAKGGWSTFASALSMREYTFGAGNREEEGTWKYRVVESNETGEAGASSESEAIKVDRTPPSTPTAAPDRSPDFAGNGGWYKDEVTVTFTSHGDPTLADGSAPSGVNPATLTAPEMFNASGSHLANGTVADFAENVSEAVTLTVQVDATPPSLEITCPATAIVGEAGLQTTIAASDGESGLAIDPSGTVTVDTSHAGPFTVTRTAVDNVGHETTRACTTQVHYPTPGAPKLTAGTNPNASGLFTLGWTGADPLQYVGLTYALQHHDAATEEWSPVAGNIGALSYEFTGAGEEEGTWNYRVQGSDAGREQTTAYSPASEAIVVDKTSPNAPTAKASRPPDFTGGGGWYRDSVKVSFTANGDPPLADGSPGSGVDLATLTSPETFETSGSQTASGTVADKVGNVSVSGTLVVQVDATPPSVEVKCPVSALVGESNVNATVKASDSESGLAVDPGGTVKIGTTHAGPVTVSRTAVDNVEHETTASCTTEVKYPTPGAPTLGGGHSPNSNGLFTLDWSGADPVQYFGLSYTLEHHDAATETWSTVETGIEALSFGFSEAGEQEGTWVYRVRGLDPTHGQTTEYSPASAHVVVDRTPPNAPTAKAGRAPDYPGKGGWYKDSVSVSFTANGDPALSDGSPGSGINASTLTAPETFSTSGAHTASGTVADNAGNVSAPGATGVQVDATPPSVEITCPESGFVGESLNATVKASDAESGLARDPSGSAPIDTATAGPVETSVTAIDNVGHETTRSCTTVLHYPTPGAPAISAGHTPNDNGLFTLGWTGADPLQNFGLSYKLQHHDAETQTWSTVTSGIEALDYEFAGAGEPEGTWVYRVQGIDETHGQTTPFSKASPPVVVDRTPPNTPTAKASRAPDYTGKGGWYKDSVAVSFTSHGDPDLLDGSPGSGVEAASLTAPETFSTSGAQTASGTVADNAGNVSAPGTLAIQVDATPPSLEVKCAAEAHVGESGVSATVVASDAESGLASDPSGTVPISTERAGPVTTTRTAADNVGHLTMRSCTTQVRESPPEYGSCVKAPSEKIGSKTVYHGFFTSSSCTTKSATQTSPYEWVSGVSRTGFHSTFTTTPVLETAAKVRLTCTSGTITGVIATAKTVGNVTMKLSGCTTASGSRCTTAGRPEGELESKRLEGVLGVWRTTFKEGKEIRSVGLDLFPAANGTVFMEFNCGEAKALTTLSGALIAQTTANKMSTTLSVKYVESSGKQKPERFEGGPRQVLTKANGEQVGLKASVLQTNEESLEINAFF
jgi:hypothetical protein